ncbi:MAG: DUF1460 domain-containing protein [Bacteroidetes bacterium]|nr:DUF1460 domain-containing protein [Fibrella sp.]
MARLFTALLLLLSIVGRAQQSVAYDQSDIRQVSLLGGPTPAIDRTLIGLGKTFLGKPYLHHTLDGNPTERLVVNFQQFDCTTFLETTLALTLALNNQPTQSVPARLEPLFRDYLTKFRYRNGRIDGYASRLHYFSDWLHDNERKGLVRDITGEIGGVQVSKAVSYMTAATHRYPHLRDPATYKQIALTEATISRQPFYFIPKKHIRDIEASLKEGDIIMLTAARPGLDMKHVGFAVWQQGRVHLLHASSDYGSVMITRYPLAEYANWHKGLSGIRVARLK